MVACAQDPCPKVLIAASWPLRRLQLKYIKRAVAQVLLVLQTVALYMSAPCLVEIHTALENGVTIIPVRLELGLPREDDQWTEHRDSLSIEDNMMRARSAWEVAHGSPMSARAGTVAEFTERWVVLRRRCEPGCSRA